MPIIDLKIKGTPGQRGTIGFGITSRGGDDIFKKILKAEKRIRGAAIRTALRRAAAKTKIAQKQTVPVRVEPYWRSRAEVRIRGELKKSITIKVKVLPGGKRGYSLIGPGYEQGRPTSRGNPGIAAIVEFGTAERFRGFQKRTRRGGRVTVRRTSNPVQSTGSVPASRFMLRAWRRSVLAGTREIARTYKEVLDKVARGG